MGDPLFWLGLSILLVAVSLTAVLVAAVPAFQELARASRSAEKLFDTLSRELPPTLQSIRSTSAEINNLTDDVSQGVQGAGSVVKQVDQSLQGAKQQAKQAQVTTKGVMAGMKAAWSVLTRPEPQPTRSAAKPAATRPANQLPAASRPTMAIDRIAPPAEVEQSISQNGSEGHHLVATETASEISAETYPGEPYLTDLTDFSDLAEEEILDEREGVGRSLSRSDSKSTPPAP
ncbi:MAG: hypothetical protein MUF49_03570 [Oculatellaceae cyanobacterium Prado106]|nr:hypothetical protein [Oculatellaceae cyanobacterium Prado106]